MSSNPDGGVHLMLSIRCINTKLLDDSRVLSSGIMSSMRNLVTRHPVAKKEHRRIVVLQSAFFEPLSRQPNLLHYNEIYRSEMFNDVVDLSPTLVTNLTCPHDKDCKIRVNIMYSSNLTGSKEIMLVGGVFGIRELLECNTNIMTVAMIGTYCEEALCFVEVIPPFPLSMTVAVPMSRPRTGANPISYNFVFYAPSESIENKTPVVNVQESCWEPRFAAKIPILFFQNVISSLTNSINAWKSRQNLERMRQGLFHNDEEAYKHKWCVLSVSVLGARFVPVDIQERLQRYGGSDTGKNGRTASIQTSNHVLGSMEELKLSSFVEVSLDDKSVPFTTNLGRTNTEHAINEPQYGSNINEHLCHKKSGKEFTASNERVRLISTPKKYSFNCVDDITASRGKRANSSASMDVKVVTVDGSTNVFAIYLSSECKDPTLRFSLFAEHDGKSILLGHGSVPVLIRKGEDALPDHQDVWVPISLSAEAVGFCSEASVHVQTLLKCNGKPGGEWSKSTKPEKASNLSIFRTRVKTTSIDAGSTHTAPHKMPEVLIRNYAKESDQLRLQAMDKPRSSSCMARTVDLEDPAAAIADCYSWLWLLGYSGTDPMAYKTAMAQDSSRPGDRSKLFSMKREASCRTEHSFRTDIPYSVPSIGKHIDEMMAVKHDLVEIYDEMVSREEQQIRWRASSMKKIKGVQGLPTNLLMQIMMIRDHRQEKNGTGSSSSDNTVEMLDSMTCGAPSPHWCGHKAGGLEHQDAELLKNRVQLEYLKDQFMNIAGDATGLANDGASAKLSKKLFTTAMEYEAFTLSVAKRRFLATSQALSILVNGIIMKLSLVMEQYIAAEVASGWLHNGFLIIFESLLSVTGNERSMLEDAMGAIDNMKQYTVRILEVSGDEANAGDLTRKPEKRRSGVKETSASASATSGRPITAHPRGSSPSGLVAEAGQSLFYHTDGAYDYSSSNKGIAVEMHGREIMLKISTPLMHLLPSTFHGTVTEGVVLKIVPVLFSQGIDMQQSVASTFSYDSSNKETMSANDMQHHVNLKALKNVNDYCWLAKPVSVCPSVKPKESDTKSPSRQIHPFCEQLDDRIRYSDITMKDVEMLSEIERLCQLLNGCRVTFCKSGKDRTGMAVTLEEARVLGERYHCGESTDHVMHNANILREFGCRIDVCEKNVGRRVYSINSIQTQFLPMLYRPPTRYLESVLKKDNS